MRILLSLFFVVFAFAAQKEVVLDVRTPAEYSSGHLDGARNLNFNGTDFRGELEKLDRDASYKVYCAAGMRAEKARAMMEKMGFKHVENLGGLSEAAAKTQRKVTTEAR